MLLNDDQVKKKTQKWILRRTLTTKLGGNSRLLYIREVI